ncbi:DNA ligase 1 [Brassica rapa]|uniref:DNA ligase 1 n=1 Tax=Brassica campestris TaxID=3711 RepID=UPI00142D5105|nr:DNA ligase 1 [Brassica rapa]
MCKSRFTKSSMKGYPLEEIYAAFGNTKVINSVLVPTVDEETLLARIIDQEPEYQREGSTSDRWNYWLNVKQKKIWWKELYESDVAARKFTKTKDKEKVTIVEGSSSNSGLESMLKGVEERIVKAMEEGFSGINLMVETKLEAMNLRMGKLEKNQRVLKKKVKKIEDKLTSIESKGNEDEEYRQWNDFDYGRDHGKDREMAEAEKAETGNKNSEKGEEDEENSGKDEEDEKTSEKGEEEKDQEHEKDKENSDSVEKGEEYVEESDEENSLLRLHERVRVQAEEFWRTVDDESEAEKEAEKEAEEEGEEEAEKEVQEEKEGEEEAEKEAEKEVEKEVQEEKEAEKEVQEEKEGEEEAEKEVQEEKEAEKEESKGTPTSTEVIVITPRGRTKAAAARKAISISPEIVVVTGIAELAEKEVEVEATQTEQEAIQTDIVEKETEVTEKDAEVAEKEDQDVEKEEETAEESDSYPDVDQDVEEKTEESEDVEEEEEKTEESEDNLVESPSEKHDELAEKSVESDVDLDVEEEEEKADEIEDNLVESPAKKQTELAEKSVEVELKTMRKPKVKVIAVPYGIPRAERLAKMRADAEKKKAKAEKKKAKADGAPKKKGRPKKTDATLKPCTPLPEKRKSEPSRWVQSPFTEGKTDELEVPKKKLKTKT